MEEVYKAIDERVLEIIKTNDEHSTVRMEELINLKQNIAEKSGVKVVDMLLPKVFEKPECKQVCNCGKDEIGHNCTGCRHYIDRANLCYLYAIYLRDPAKERCDKFEERGN